MVTGAKGGNPKSGIPFENGNFAREAPEAHTIGGATRAVFAGGILLLWSAVAARGALLPDPDDPTQPVTDTDVRLHYEDDTVSAQTNRLSLVLRQEIKWDIADGARLAARVDVPLTISDAGTDQRYRTGLPTPAFCGYNVGTSAN
jgi:hypothetical protein